MVLFNRCKIINTGAIKLYFGYIISFLCCLFVCLMLVSFVYLKVDSSYAAGDYDGALRNSNIARWLNIASIIFGLIIYISIVSSSFAR